MADTDELVRLATTDFSALGVVEDDKGLYLPTQVRRRAKNGKAEVMEEILLRCPSTLQRMRARTMAREFCTKELGLDLTLDAKQFDDFENYAILCFAIRDPKTRGQLEPDLRALVERYTDQMLAEVWAKLNVWTDMMDPRYGELSAEKLWQVIVGVAGGNLLPLVAMPTYGQSTCIAAMAAEALLSPTAPSWARSRGTSPPAPSPDASSSESSETASSKTSSDPLPIPEAPPA